MTNLSPAHKTVLLGLANGCSLKSHRYLDGTKIYQLHPLDRPTEIIERTIVESLYDQGLIDSNQKFPAAAYWLTEKGRQLVTTLNATEAC